MRRSWLLAACAASVAVIGGILVVRSRLVIVRVKGSSMKPVYADGDVLLAARLPPGYHWQAGEDLVFARTGPDLVPGDPPYLVKRVCALPGDPDPRSDLGDALVPADWLILQGLNSTGSRPSYYSIPVEVILARVLSRQPFRQS